MLITFSQNDSEVSYSAQLEDSETCMAVHLTLALEQLGVLTDSLEALMESDAKLSENDSAQVSIIGIERCLKFSLEFI